MSWFRRGGGKGGFAKTHKDGTHLGTGGVKGSGGDAKRASNTREEANKKRRKTSASAPASSDSHGSIYVLKLKNNCVYVGHTNKDPEERLREHCNGSGAAWTRRHEPIKFLKPPRPATRDTGIDEDKETKIQMKKFGIAFVRGGSYTQLELSEHQESALRQELYHDAGTCKQCNSSDHYVLQCPQTAGGGGGGGGSAKKATNTNTSTSTSTITTTTTTTSSTTTSSTSEEARSCDICSTDISNKPAYHNLCYNCFLQS